MTEPEYIPHRAVDKRYKDGVDTGAMSSNRIPLPLKPRVVKPAIEDDNKERHKQRGIKARIEFWKKHGRPKPNY